MECDGGDIRLFPRISRFGQQDVSIWPENPKYFIHKGSKKLGEMSGGREALAEGSRCCPVFPSSIVSVFSHFPGLFP